MENRVAQGMGSQEVVAMRLRRLAREAGVAYRVHGVASAGQHQNDLEVSYGGFRFFVEVKGLRNRNADVVLLEKSVRRTSVPPELNRCTAALARSVLVGGARLDDLMKRVGYKPGLIGTIDFFRDHVDPAVGLSEDLNSPPSGKLPKELATEVRSVTGIIRKIVVGKMTDEQNAYLALHDKSRDTVDIYHTGYGQNPLGADPVPAFSKVKIDTYGGSSKGATRVAVKSSLLV